MKSWEDIGRSGRAYQSLGGAVEGMPVVSPELGVGAVQRGVALGLGLLDAVRGFPVSYLDAVAGVVRSWAVSYPFRCALRDWLCWDEFLDSGKRSSVSLGKKRSRGRRRRRRTGHCEGFRLRLKMTESEKLGCKVQQPECRLRTKVGGNLE